jgi:hypothetical protein
VTNLPAARPLKPGHKSNYWLHGNLRFAALCHAKNSRDHAGLHTDPRDTVTPHSPRLSVSVSVRSGSWLYLPRRLATLGLRAQVEGEGELLLASHRGFHKPSPPEPLLEMKVGSLSSLPLRILDALQLNPG